MDNKNNGHTIKLSIIGKGPEIEKMQKRLRCAARATGTELYLSWQHEFPQSLHPGAKHSTAVTCNDKLVLDGLKPTEEIERLLIKLKEGT